METAPITSAMDIDMMRVNATTAQRLSDMKKATMPGSKFSPKRADEVAIQFEAQFISSMLENMFSNIDTDGPLGGGEAEKTYRSFMVDEYGKLIARAGGIGVADHVKREMLSMQEVPADSLTNTGGLNAASPTA